MVSFIDFFILATKFRNFSSGKDPSFPIQKSQETSGYWLDHFEFLSTFIRINLAVREQYPTASAGTQ
jgi:hypothetical protein